MEIKDACYKLNREQMEQLSPSLGVDMSDLGDGDEFIIGALTEDAVLHAERAMEDAGFAVVDEETLEKRRKLRIIREALASYDLLMDDERKKSKKAGWRTRDDEPLIREIYLL